MTKLVELFAGDRSIGKVAEKHGLEVFSVDWEPYDGIDLVADIGKMQLKDVPFVPDVVWASPDCTTYSIAACSTHRTNTKEPKTPYAVECDTTNQHWIGMIKQWLEINPNLIFFIENPRGMLRHMDWMKEFKRHTVWYCQYGDERAKPTDVWTNSTTWIPRPMCRNYKYDKDGEIIDRHCHHHSARRGAKTGTQGRKSSYERSMIPVELCEEIIKSINNTMTKKKSNTPMVVVPDMKKMGLEETKASEIRELFVPMLDVMEKYEKEYNTIVKAEVSEATAKAARTLRLKYVKVRTATAKIHKGAKAYHLAAGKALDGFKNAQLFAGSEIETKLSEIENFEEAQKQAEIDEKTKSRKWKLGEFGMAVSKMPKAIGEWEDEVWDEYLAGVKAKYKADKEAELQVAKAAKQVTTTPVDTTAVEATPVFVEHPDEFPNDEIESGVNTTTGEILTDKDLALRLILDLNNLANKYTFKSDQYKHAYSAMGKRFADMEKYLRMLNKTQ